MSDLISRQAVKDLLLYSWMTKKAPVILDPYLSLVLQNIDELPSAQQWIPVTDRLPKEEEKTYWVCTDAGTQCECRWTNINHFWTDLTTNWHWHIVDIPQYTKVTAWMPLPEPYKVVTHIGGKDDKNVL